MNLSFFGGMCMANKTHGREIPKRVGVKLLVSYRPRLLSIKLLPEPAK